MIIYIASYPRSGNFWLQNLLANQFKRLTTNVHEGINNPSMLEPWTNTIKEYYDLDVYPLDNSDSTKYGELSNWMVNYKSPDEERPRKGILPGCWESLNNADVRNILAHDNECYFLKTHFYPHSEYLQGEYVIQIVRHPGACLWSYYNFKRDVRNTFDDDLSALIQGRSGFGNWSQYHMAWIETAKILGAHYLRVRYEDLFGSELEFCKKLQNFFNLPIVSEELRLFDFYHKLDPTLTREGKAGGWGGNYSKAQLRLLWNTHREMMTHFGYQEPNYDLGLDEARN